VWSFVSGAAADVGVVVSWSFVFGLLVSLFQDLVIYVCLMSGWSLVMVLFIYLCLITLSFRSSLVF